MRVKGEYLEHRKINTAMGIKICAPGLEDAVAGCSLFVCNDEEELEEIKEECQDEFDEIVNDFDKQPEGVYVQASTLGSLEALLSFLKQSKIPVFQVNIGVVHKMDVKRGALMNEKKVPEYAVILGFDVKVDAEATKEAKRNGVQIFTADIIYHLFDKFTAYMNDIKEQKKRELQDEAVFPVVCKIGKDFQFNKKDPIVVGVDILDGIMKVGTPLCVPDVGNLVIGKVTSIEKEHKEVKDARKGAAVCIKIEPNQSQKHITLGRHFTTENTLVSRITRQSLDIWK